MFKVYKECCKNCLLSPDRIVSSEAMKSIINECKTKQTHFICHKATIQNKDVCCKKFYDELGHTSNLIRVAERLGAVEFIDQTDTDKLPTYKEMNNEIQP